MGEYRIEIIHEDGTEDEARLGTTWEVNTAHPNWYELLPEPPQLAEALSEYERGGERMMPTKEDAAGLLERMGFAGLAEAVLAEEGTAVVRCGDCGRLICTCPEEDTDYKECGEGGPR